MITRGLYKKYSGDDLSLIDEYKHAIKVLYQDGSIDLLLFKPLDENTIFVTIASMVKSEDQLETPVRTGLMKRLD